MIIVNLWARHAGHDHRHALSGQCSEGNENTPGNALRISETSSENIEPLPRGSFNLIICQKISHTSRGHSAQPEPLICLKLLYTDDKSREELGGKSSATPKELQANPCKNKYFFSHFSSSVKKYDDPKENLRSRQRMSYFHYILCRAITFVGPFLSNAIDC